MNGARRRGARSFRRRGCVLTFLASWGCVASWTWFALAGLLLAPARGQDVPESWLDVPVPPREERPEASPETIAAGKEIFNLRCSFCHGVRGDGNGPVAPYLLPRPRDFTVGGGAKGSELDIPLFKFRTTASGELPSDEDLYRTISRGAPGTAMPPWGYQPPILSPLERWQVIAYLKTFSDPDWLDPEESEYWNEPDTSPYREPEDPSEAILFDFSSPAPPATPQALARGRDLFRDPKGGGCVECHGLEGRGDGVNTGTHFDNWGYPTLPTDLTQPGLYRNGRTTRDIFRTLTVGLLGTPMPSYGHTLDPDPAADDRKRWDLALYVRSLQVDAPEVAGSVLVASQARGPLPLDPLDAAWGEVPALVVPLAGQLVVRPRWDNPSVTRIRVQAMHDGSRVAFRLSWDDRFADEAHHDPSPEEEAADVAEPYVAWWSSAYDAEDLPPRHRQYVRRDAVGLQFPMTMPDGPRKPYLVRGDPGHPVYLVEWRADLQFREMLREKLGDDETVEDALRSLVGARKVSGGELRLFDLAAVMEGKKIRGIPAEVGERMEAHRGPLDRALSLAGKTRRGWTLNDLFEAVAGRDEIDGAVAVREAAGPKSVPRKLVPPGPSWQARAIHGEGLWTVVLARDLHAGPGSKANGAVAFEPGRPIPFALSVWDGRNGESGNRRSLSSWYTLVLERTLRPGDFLPALTWILLAGALEWRLVRALGRRVRPEGSGSGRSRSRGREGVTG